jgi:phytoene dehydrogenase-like protein
MVGKAAIVFSLCVAWHHCSAAFASFGILPIKHQCCVRSVQTAYASNAAELQDSYDVVVVGSGVGGLSAAAMLSLYGYSVCVLESHYAPGGCAHGFAVRDNDVGTFNFDTGPSFFSGLNPNLPAKSSNPLRTVLDAVGEKVDCVPYDSFGLKFPEGDFVHTPNFAGDVLNQVSGPRAVSQWKKLMTDMEPLESAVAALPTAAIRFDVGGLLTVTPFLANFGRTNPLENLKLTKPFQSIVDGAGVTDKFTQNWLDLLCFCLSGLPASGTITAEMALMMGEFYQPGAVMDCPRTGAKAIVDALVRGVEKHGGSIVCKCHVAEIVVENGRATGVRLQKGDRKVIAKKAVISNLSVWDLFGSGIVDKRHFPDSFVQNRMETPIGKSFMHLHLGFKATRDELEKLQAHYMYIDDWDRGVEAEDNAVLVSIPSVHDESLAPEGYGVLHYTPATEDFARWENVKRNSPEYKALKDERSAYLWSVAEKIIPDIRVRAKIAQVG